MELSKNIFDRFILMHILCELGFATDDACFIAKVFLKSKCRNDFVKELKKMGFMDSDEKAITEALFEEDQ